MMRVEGVSCQVVVGEGVHAGGAAGALSVGIKEQLGLKGTYFPFPSSTFHTWKSAKVTL